LFVVFAAGAGSELRVQPCVEKELETAALWWGDAAAEAKWGGSWVSTQFVSCSCNWEGKEAVVVQRPQENEGWVGTAAL
jgi:hypothetical protein